MKTINLLLTLLAAAPSVALSNTAPVEKRWVQPVALTSGALSNLTDQPQERLLGVLVAPGASRVRVVFAEAALGAASKVRLVSIKDNQSQTLSAAQLAIWSQTSALFNGNRVRLEVILAPGDTVAVEVKQVLAFSSRTDGREDAGPETLCGPDNRVASGDNRVGRFAGGCTGWLTANGAVLTAGHCGIVSGSILEVNVPASLANGTTVASAVQDQFPTLANSITTVNSGVGNDWTVCRIGPNSLGQFAHQLYGFFRMTRELPAAAAIVRVTGCGTDNTPPGSTGGFNAQNQTLQTAADTFTGESGGGSAISLQYTADTEPGNSGSPIIWQATGFTIGIHTAGGCTANSGSNNGTSFELDALENAIAAIPGLTVTPIIPRQNIRYLDSIRVPNDGEDGTVFQPHDTLAEAVNAVPIGGLLSITAGGYSAAGARTINKRMTIHAPVGSVILGN